MGLLDKAIMPAAAGTDQLQETPQGDQPAPAAETARRMPQRMA
jgi:hypothetical protein